MLNKANYISNMIKIELYYRLLHRLLYVLPHNHYPPLESLIVVGLIFRGGEAFSETCSLTKEPEDVTVGLIVG